MEKNKTDVIAYRFILFEGRGIGDCSLFLKKGWLGRGCQFISIVIAEFKSGKSRKMASAPLWSMQIIIHRLKCKK